MRVISGTSKGRRLKGPRSDKIRPALDKVKQAIFNILCDLEELRVADLYAGTGSIGIEALSRGAGEAVFVDSAPEALQIVKKNLDLCRLHGLVLKLELPQGIGLLGRKFKPFDLIFVDPPYDHNLINPTLRAIEREKILTPEGRIVVEHSPREPIGNLTGLSIIDQRKYGQTLISFLVKSNTPPPFPHFLIPP